MGDAELRTAKGRPYGRGGNLRAAIGRPYDPVS